MFSEPSGPVACHQRSLKKGDSQQGSTSRKDQNPVLLTEFVDGSPRVRRQEETCPSVTSTQHSESKDMDRPNDKLQSSSEGPEHSGEGTVLTQGSPAFNPQHTIGFHKHHQE